MDSQEEPTVICSNCDKHIPESKSFLHEAYCFRNIIKCPKCNEPVHKEEMEAHHKEAHQLVSCKFCKKDFEAKSLSQHEQTCFHKPRMCPYCNCDINSHEYGEHVYQCGSRTRKCTFCNQNIIMRDLEAHEAACEVEQFTRGTEEHHFLSEESKTQTFEDILARPNKVAVVGDNKRVLKKRFEPFVMKPDATKKRLTKFSDRSESDSKTQDELDEEIARKLNEEFFGGNRRTRGGVERQKTQEELDEELAQELNKEFYEGRTTTKPQQNPTRKLRKMYQEEESEEDKVKKLDEEFFSVGRKGRDRAEAEKPKSKPKKVITIDDDDEDEDAAMARRLQEEFNRGSQASQAKPTKQQSQTSRQAKQNNSRKTKKHNYEESSEEQYDYEEETEDVSESNYYEPKPNNRRAAAQNKKGANATYEQHEEDYNFEHDDPELQRAIQASLEGWN